MRSARGSGRQPPWAACVCGIGDTSRCRALLKRYGCVIFRGVATGPECVELEGLFWDWLEREHPSVDRSRPATHAPHVFEALGYKNTGVVNTGSIGQSQRTLVSPLGIHGKQRGAKQRIHRQRRSGKRWPYCDVSPGPAHG